MVISSDKLDFFEVFAGVKQDCVLEPVIFNLFLVAVKLVFRNGLSNEVGAPFKYRFNESLFNL